MRLFVVPREYPISNRDDAKTLGIQFVDASLAVFVMFRQDDQNLTIDLNVGGIA